MKKNDRTPTLIAVGATTLLFVLTVGLLLLAPGPPGEPPAERTSGNASKRVLRFGKIPNLSARVANRRYTGLFALLDSKLSCCQLELVLAPDYNSCVKMLADRKIDLAWLGTGTYVAARRRIPMTPIVRPIWSGRKDYRGVIFTVESTGISSLKQLKGKRLAFVDRQSASGYIYPAALLAAEGLNLDTDFAQVDFLGSHDAVLMAVLLGEYDAGAVFQQAFGTVADRAKRVRLRTVAQTEPVPGEPIVAGVHLEPEVVAEIRAAFLSLEPEELAAAKIAGLEELFGFAQVTDQDYDDVNMPGD